MSKGPMAITAAIVAAALAGCGGSSSNSSAGASLSAFKTAFTAQRQTFNAIGADLQKAIVSAPTSTPSAIASEFGSLASRTTAAAAALRTLKPPARYQSQVGQLETGFTSVAADLTAVSSAAQKNDATAARTAAAKLVADSRTVHSADLNLVHQLGLKTTTG